MTAAIGVKQSHKAWERLGSHQGQVFVSLL